MSYRPENKKIMLGDTWHCPEDSRVHAFFLQFQKQGEEAAGNSVGAIGHAVSDDMLCWQTLSDAVPVGEAGSYDELDHYTGCTVADGGKLYLFYTSRSTAPPEISCSLAVSEDGVNFEKHRDNPLFTPDERFYYGVNNRPHFLFHGNWDPASPQYDYRDICVVRDEINGGWYGFFVARVPGETAAETAAIGLAHSDDLVRWEQFPPCFLPGRYHVIETPEVFKMGDKWYMLCLSGNVYGQRHCTDEKIEYDRVTIYAEADDPAGPYREPAGNVLIANMNASAACAKTVVYRGVRYLFYTEVWQENGEVKDMFMSAPKPVVRCDDGSLYLGWYKEIEKYYSDEKYTLDASNAIDNKGEWGNHGDWKFAENAVRGVCPSDWSVQPFEIKLRDFVFEATVSTENAKTVGFFFDAGDNIFAGGKCVLFDFSLNEALLCGLRDFTRLDARDFRFDEKPFRIRVYVKDQTVEIYINDRMVLHHLTGRREGRVGLLIEGGAARFSDMELHGLRDFTKER